MSQPKQSGCEGHGPLRQKEGEGAPVGYGRVSFCVQLGKLRKGCVLI